jgi:hypothetical protein
MLGEQSSPGSETAASQNQADPTQGRSACEASVNQQRKAKIALGPESDRPARERLLRELIEGS